MERNRKSRNGQFAKEKQWPKRITRAYAFKMLHNAYMRFYLKSEGRIVCDTEYISARSAQVLGKARRDMIEGK